MEGQDRAIAAPRFPKWWLGVLGMLLGGGLLAAVLVTALDRARDGARLVGCQSNLYDIIKNVITYKEKHNDNLPGSLTDLFPDYIDNPKVFICYADGAPMTIAKGIKCSYRYIGSVPCRDLGPGQFIAYDHVPHRSGRNVASYDGHVTFCAEADFRKALAEDYETFKPLLAKPDFPGDRERVKAFFEDRDFPEK